MNTKQSQMFAAKQFVCENFSGLCQELYAWRNNQPPAPGGLISQLSELCGKYTTDEEFSGAREAETLIEQSALLFGAGAEITPNAISDQVRRGLFLSMGLPPKDFNES
jgi:hypothetical protein